MALTAMSVPECDEYDIKMAEAINRAENGLSLANYAPIIEGFSEKGIPLDEIVPRVNVFTYNVWRAKGRQVRKGEKGVKIVSFIPTVDDNGKEKRYPKGATVFHISQTDPIEQ